MSISNTNVKYYYYYIFLYFVVTSKYYIHKVGRGPYIFVWLRASNYINQDHDHLDGGFMLVQNWAHGDDNMQIA